jgi:hypothetical protein
MTKLFSSLNDIKLELEITFQRDQGGQIASETSPIETISGQVNTILSLNQLLLSSNKIHFMVQHRL